MRFAASRRELASARLNHQTASGQWGGEANGGTPLAARDACAPHFQLSCHGLTARKFSHILIVPEESGPTFFQAFTSLNKPELVNESENPLRVK